MKTHSGTKKRIKITGTGKFMMKKASKRHLLIKKSMNQKKLGLGGITVTHADAGRMKKLLPYA